MRLIENIIHAMILESNKKVIIHIDRSLTELKQPKNKINQDQINQKQTTHKMRIHRRNNQRIVVDR